VAGVPLQLQLDAPLARADGLGHFAEGLGAGQGAWDVSAGWDSLSGAEARARAAYGLGNGITARAEVFAQTTDQGLDYGALASIGGRF
jgi:hypothetical protein